MTRRKHKPRSPEQIALYRARSASDNDPNWPLWFVELQGPNGTATGIAYGGRCYTKAFCEALAESLNRSDTATAGG